MSLFGNALKREYNKNLKQGSAPIPDVPDEFAYTSRYLYWNKTGKFINQRKTLQVEGKISEYHNAEIMTVMKDMNSTDNDTTMDTF